MFGWFGKKSEDKEFRVLDLLETYKNEDQGNSQEMFRSPLMSQIEKCSQLYNMLNNCFSGELGVSDPKCVLLHQAYMVCVGRELNPELFQQYADCAKRNRNNMQLCDSQYQKLWAWVVQQVRTTERNNVNAMITEDEREAITDCQGYDEKAKLLLNDEKADPKDQDEALEKWMKCCVSKICSDEYKSYQKCLNEGNGNCFEEGKPLFKCTSRFVLIYSRLKTLQ